MSYIKLCAIALIIAATSSCGDQPYFMETISFDGQNGHIIPFQNLK